MARPARPWFRFYVEAVHDRKLRRLKPEYRWLFVACLAAARQSPEPGWLLIGHNDPMGWDDLTDFAAMPLKAVEQGTDALMDAGVIGYDLERKAWYVPNWSARQFESDDVTMRTTKHRSKERPNADARTAVGTPPETEAETETDPLTPPIDFEHRPTPKLAHDLTLNGLANVSALRAPKESA